MHNVDAAALIIVRILDEQKITVFIRQVQVIGIEGSDFFFMNQKLALIPMVGVFGRIKNESLYGKRRWIFSAGRYGPHGCGAAEAVCGLRMPFAR